MVVYARPTFSATKCAIFQNFFSRRKEKRMIFVQSIYENFLNRMHTRNDLCERHSECFHSLLNLSMDSICMKKKNIVQQQTSTY